MKKQITLLLMIALTFSAFSGKGDSLKDYQAGNTAFKAKDYEAAIVAYEKCLTAGATSSELEYNLGNACYKSGRNAEAILHYERALRFSPGDEDIRYNLRIASLKNTDRIETLPKVFYERWFEGLTMIMNERSWTIMLLIFTWLTFSGIACYFLARRSDLKKISFFATVLCGLITLVIWSFASTRSDVEFGNDRAVVMKTSVYVKSSPDEKGNDLFILHDGTTVEVLDELEGWKRIRIANGSSGWLPSGSIEVI